MDQKCCVGFVRKLMHRSTTLGSATAAASLLITAQPASADLYVNSSGTDQVLNFDEVTGELLGVFKAPVPYAAASQTGPNGDYFTASRDGHSIMRFDTKTLEFIGDFIAPGAGGLIDPVAPNFGPDGFVYVSDANTSRVLRYDAQGRFVDIFADPATSPLSNPLMMDFDRTAMYQASYNNNRVLKYDLATKEYLGDFVAAGSGGLVGPVGLQFGPDGDLYTSSFGTDNVLRYDGETGEFIEAFVPAGSGGLKGPRALRFGGPNTDLYVTSFTTNKIMQYDRTTGAFIRTLIDLDTYGVVEPRGLSFSASPEVFFVKASPAVVDAHANEEFVAVSVNVRVRDFTDEHPKVVLESVTVDGPARDVKRNVKGARVGTNDLGFDVRARGEHEDRTYTFTYSATNAQGKRTLATTKVKVLGASGCTH